MPAFDDLVNAMLVLTHAGEHLPGEHDQSEHGNRDGGGGSVGAGTSKLAQRGAKIEQFGTDLKWEAEDTIAGEVVLTTDNDADLSDADEDEIKQYLKSALPKYEYLSGLRNESDIEDISLSGVEKGQGYIRIKVDITPTEDAGRSHFEGRTEFEDAMFALTGGSTPGSIGRGE